MSETLSVLLERAGLPLTAEEYERMDRNLPILHAWLDELHIDTARYAEPATVFRAAWLIPRGGSVAKQ
jgi:hypothetical protein